MVHKVYFRRPLDLAAQTLFARKTERDWPLRC